MFELFELHIIILYVIKNKQRIFSIQGTAIVDVLLMYFSTFIIIQLDFFVMLHYREIIFSGILSIKMICVFVLL